MHVCKWNARTCSLVNKIRNFQLFVYSSSFSAFAITETWLSNHMFDNEVLPHNFIVYSNNRASHDGGTLLAIHNSICSKLISAPTDLEGLSVEISSLQLYFCVAYITPNCSQHYYSNLLSYICSFTTKYSNVIILGDFNFPDINWSSLVVPLFSIIYLVTLFFNLILFDMYPNPLMSMVTP